MSKRRSKATDQDTAVEYDETGGSNGAQAETAELEKVRAILFGEKDREIRDRLASLEKLIHEISQQASGRVDLEVEALREMAGAEKAAAVDRLASESASRQAQFEEIEKRLDEYSRTTGRALDDIREKLAGFAASAQESRVELGNEIRAELSDKADSITQRLDEAVSKLEVAKTSQVQLADLFEQLAAGLRK